MPNDQITRLEALLGQTTSSLDSMRGELTQLLAAITGGAYPSAEATDRVVTSIAHYRRQAETLDTALSAEGLAAGGTIAELQTAIARYAEALEAARLREPILDFLRLTTASARSSAALEEQKDRLLTLCRTLPDGALQEAILPFRMAAEHVKGGGSLSDEQFDELEEALGRSFTRALDRNELLLDTSAALDAYLDGSVALLRPIGSGAASGEPAPTPAPPAVDPLEGYTGLLSSVRVKLSTNHPADELRAGTFKSLAGSVPGIDRCLHFLAREKLYAPDQQATERHYAPPFRGAMDILFRNGYIAVLEIECELLKRRYYTLTDKGYACFRKDTVVQYLKANAGTELNGTTPNATLPAELLLSCADWTETHAVQAALLHDYMASEGDSAHVLCALPDNGCMYACTTDDRRELVLAAVAQTAEELRAVIELIRGLTTAEQSPAVLTLLAPTDVDAERIRRALEAIGPVPETVQLRVYSPGA